MTVSPLPGSIKRSEVLAQAAKYQPEPKPKPRRSDTALVWLGAFILLSGVWLLLFG